MPRHRYIGDLGGLDRLSYEDFDQLVNEALTRTYPDIDLSACVLSIEIEWTDVGPPDPPDDPDLVSTLAVQVEGPDSSGLRSDQECERSERFNAHLEELSQSTTQRSSKEDVHGHDDICIC